MKKLTIFFFVIFYIQNIASQNLNTQENLYAFLDSTISNVNTKLSYGDVYKERYIKRTKNNHNFFKTNKFTEGNITYRNEVFYNTYIKYDIVNDNIILKISNLNQYISIIPEKAFVEHFSIGKAIFFNTKKYGFLEKLSQKKEFSIFRKHSKVSIENNDNNYIHHTFKKKPNVYYIYTKDEYFPVRSKKDFIRIFPEKRKNITSFFRQNKILFKSDFKKFIANLLEQIHN